MEIAFQDLQYAIRKLRRSPNFTLVAVSTLAIAIGASTAMFSVVNSVILNPLPYADPAHLMYVTSALDKGGKPAYISPPDFIDYKSKNHSFADLNQFETGSSVTLLRKAAPAVRLSQARVGATFFSMLGIHAAVGRVFDRGEDDRAAPRVAMISQGIWRSMFGSDPAVVGETMILDGQAFTLVGVAPSGFAYPGNPDVWIPLVWTDADIRPGNRGSHTLEAVGRLAQGATTASALRDLTSVAKQLETAYPASNATTTAFVEPLQDRVVGSTQVALVTMLGAVAFVLLIACANVANLMLVRAAARESEIAVRSALGAGRARIVRQVVTESIVVSLAGAALGYLLSLWIVDCVITFGPHDLPRLAEISIDGRVLAVTLGVSLLTGVVFGLIPAYHAARADVSQMLRRSSRSASRRGASHTRNALVVGEMALAVMLLVGAGLLLRSYDRLMHVDPGFSADHLVTFNVALPGSSYEYDQQTLGFVNQVVARVSSLPGVENVAAAAGRPIQPDAPFSASVGIKSLTGRPADAPGKSPSTRIFAVSPSFFATFRIPIKLGRVFTDAENRPDVAQAVVVDEEFVRRYSPNESPIGKHLLLGIKHSVTASPADTVRAGGEIVGVVADVKNAQLSEREFPTTYVAYGSNPFGVSITVRTTNDPVAMQAAIRGQVESVDREAAIYDMTTMQAELAETVSAPRFYTTLLGAFAVVALLIASLGMFGVVSYAVSQRSRELGVRVALGATPSGIIRMVMGNGLLLAGIGLVIGAAGAAALTREIASLLFNVTPLDAVTFCSACGVLLLVAAIASWLPARRAARVDPTVAMQAE